MAEIVKVTVGELSNALALAVQARFLSVELSGVVFKKYLRDNDLLPQKEEPILTEKKKSNE